MTREDLDYMNTLLDRAIGELEHAEQVRYSAAKNTEAVMAVLIHLHPEFLGSETREDALEGKHPDKPWQDEILERAKALRVFLTEDRYKA